MKYTGKNTKTEYLYVMLVSNILSLIYAILLTALLVFLTIISIKACFNTDILTIMIMLSAVLIVLSGLIIAFDVIKVISIIKYSKERKYYKNVELEIIKEEVLFYDYKLWLTAVKDSYHPMAITHNDNTYKTGIIFTNSEKFYIFPKFKMPASLIARNYVKNKAIVGYDKNKDEYIIINFKEGEE